MADDFEDEEPEFEEVVDDEVPEDLDEIGRAHV